MRPRVPSRRTNAALTTHQHSVLVTTIRPQPSVPAAGPGMAATLTARRRRDLHCSGHSACEVARLTHTGRGACGWLAAGGTMRALTEDEIWHDPWEEAAAEGAVRRWIEDKKHRSSTTLRITSTSSAIPLSSFQWQLLARRKCPTACSDGDSGLAGVLDV